MEAIRRIYESLPDVISVPPELRRRRVEIIILPLDENGDDSPNILSDEERRRALENLMKHAGAAQSGNPNGGDNEQIDADLAREYGRDL
ncbi:MAG: hypothetical protein ACR2N3_10360 [Pyrinomonadaceae bacterium]